MLSPYFRGPSFESKGRIVSPFDKTDQNSVRPPLKVCLKSKHNVSGPGFEAPLFLQKAGRWVARVCRNPRLFRRSEWGEGGLGIERFTGTASERKGTVENLPEGMECAEDEEVTAGRGASDEDPGRGTDKSPGGTEGPAMFGKTEVERTGPEDCGYSTKLPERSWLYIPLDAAANMECQMEACSTRSSE